MQFVGKAEPAFTGLKTQLNAPTANQNHVQYGGTVYILTNVHHTVLYIGVTSDLFTRIAQHVDKEYSESFTAKFNCNILVYYETYGRIEEAIAREKQLKKWNRAWKEALIIKMNPEWKDLFKDM